MIKARAVVTLAEVADVVTQTFEGLPLQDLPESRQVARIVRAELLSKFKEAFGADWCRAWDYTADRRQHGSQS